MSRVELVAFVWSLFGIDVLTARTRERSMILTPVKAPPTGISPAVTFGVVFVCCRLAVTDGVVKQLGVTSGSLYS